jgi:hypothetical protein
LRAKKNENRPFVDYLILLYCVVLSLSNTMGTVFYMGGPGRHRNIQGGATLVWGLGRVCVCVCVCMCACVSASFCLTHQRYVESCLEAALPTSGWHCTSGSGGGTAPLGGGAALLL